MDPKNVISVELYADLLRGGRCVIVSSSVLSSIFNKLIELYGTDERITLPVQLRDRSWVDVTLTSLKSELAGIGFTGFISHPDGSGKVIEIEGLFALLSGGSFRLFG